jgi:hypothetical protein
MMQAVAARAGELLAAVLIAAGICVALAATGLWWLKRRLRRRIETIGLAAARRAAGAAAGIASAAGWWLRPRREADVSGAVRTDGDRRPGLTGRTRQGVKVKRCPGS